MIKCVKLKDKGKNMRPFEVGSIVKSKKLGWGVVERISFGRAYCKIFAFREGQRTGKYGSALCFTETYDLERGIECSKLERTEVPTVYPTYEEMKDCGLYPTYEEMKDCGPHLTWNGYADEIILIKSPRKGSKDARLIVTMLATIYRRNKRELKAAHERRKETYLQNLISPENIDNSETLVALHYELEQQAFRIYTVAKGMLDLPVNKI
jgi:hypothetical protein